MLFSLEEFERFSKRGLYRTPSPPCPLRPSEHAWLSVLALSKRLRNVSPLTLFELPREATSVLTSLIEWKPQKRYLAKRFLLVLAMLRLVSEFASQRLCSVAFFKPRK